MRALLCVLSACAIWWTGFGIAAAAELPARTRAEIAHLLKHLERSGCEFYRNGEWHEAIAAKKHINRKYNYLLKRNLVRNSEDFIRLAATQSSTSGEAYRVRCPGNEARPSSAWLTEELARYRERSAAR